MERSYSETLAFDMPKAGDTSSRIMKEIYGVLGDVLLYDKRIFSKDWDAFENPVIDYFTRSDVATQIYGHIHSYWQHQSPSPLDEL